MRLSAPAGAGCPAARIENVDAATVRRRRPEVDRVRAQYVHGLYRANIDDPELFHLQIDSTVVPLEVCGTYRSRLSRQL